MYEAPDLAGERPQPGLVLFPFLMERLKERGVDADYMREYYLFSKLSPGRVDYLLTRLEEVEDVQINRDFSPILIFVGFNNF